MSKQLVPLMLALLFLLSGGAVGQEVKQIFLGTTPAVGHSRQGGQLFRFEIGGVASLGLTNAGGNLAMLPASLAQGFNTPVLSERLVALVAIPNPANRHVDIQWPASLSFNQGAVTLFNLLGQPVLSRRVEADRLLARLYLGDLSRGVYIARLSNESGQPLGSARIVVCR